LITEALLSKLLILENLRGVSEITVRELAWRTGIRENVLIHHIVDLQRTHLIEIGNNRVSWNIADNPSTLKPWGWRLEHKIVTGSVLDYVRGCGLWTVALSEYQMYGRGRHGRRWIGNLGGLWIALRLPLLPGNASYVSIAAPLIIVEILRRNYGINAWIKWPNDVVCNDKKLVGVLVEAEAYQDKIVANIGIGINVNNSPPLPNTTSLKKLMGRLIPRNSLLSLIIGWFGRIHKLLEDPKELLKKYMENMATLNRRVRAKTVAGEIEGIAIDVDEYGYLTVETPSGKKLIDPDTTLELRHLD